MSAPITPNQRAVLDSLICERLSSNPDNKVLIKGIVNTRNPNLVRLLQSNRAWQEDEGNITAYYLVKSQSGVILAFFALRCGEVFQNVDEELVKGAKSFRQNLDKLLNASLDEEERSKVLVQVSSALREGWTEQLADYYLKKSKLRHRDTVVDNNKDNHQVAKAFSAVEITLFCNNEANGVKEEWEAMKLPHSRGVTVFWEVMMQRIQEVVNLVGCQYLYLFAADDEADGTLVNYYKTKLQFETPVKLGSNKPSFDYGCFFLCQRVNVLLKHRIEFYDNFNVDVADAV